MSSLLIAWNISSFYFIVKLHKNLKDQYSHLIETEINLLNGSESTDRFDKYNFIKSLKLDLFFRNKIILKTVALSIPYIIPLILENHTKILSFIKGFIQNYLR
jgi:hypothetical protein